VRSIEPMARLTMDCRIGYAENASATDEEITNSPRHKALRLVGVAEIPTLHRARFPVAGQDSQDNTLSMFGHPCNAFSARECWVAVELPIPPRLAVVRPCRS